ncbi:MAG: type II toxin-antitoxin system RelB/DinJ family antitoxin, partial [Campylobacterota bacterium]|nr:type II toxin-antitoxin system RelB/DinJ family antitoxin [Campylobacterota bacterium]
MALDATVRARVDSHLKQDVEEILSQLGMTTSQAINIFMNSIKRENGIPFELKVPNKETVEAMRDVEEGRTESITFEQLKNEAKV